MLHVDLPAYDQAMFARKYGPWAVIAGASEGSGARFAEQLAAAGVNLVLVSRRKELLETLGNRLSQLHKIDFLVVTADLKAPDAGERLVAACAGLDVGLYVSNAGSDGAGNSFLGAPLARAQDLLGMNVRTLIDAAHGFGNRFKARGGGGMIIMSSCAGLGGQPWLAMYAATKAFEMNFAESLWAELQADNIDVLGVGAPSMDTPTLRRGVAGSDFDMNNVYDPAEIVHVALATLGRDPLVIFPDGPFSAQTAQIQLDRRQRLIALSEWAKAYTRQHAQTS